MKLTLALSAAYALTFDECKVATSAIPSTECSNVTVDCIRGLAENAKDNLLDNCFAGAASTISQDIFTIPNKETMDNLFKAVGSKFDDLVAFVDDKCTSIKSEFLFALIEGANPYNAEKTKRQLTVEKDYVLEQEKLAQAERVPLVSTVDPKFSKMLQFTPECAKKLVVLLKKAQNDPERVAVDNILSMEPFGRELVDIQTISKGSPFMFKNMSKYDLAQYPLEFFKILRFQHFHVGVIDHTKDRSAETLRLWISIRKSFNVDFLKVRVREREMNNAENYHSVVGTRAYTDTHICRMITEDAPLFADSSKTIGDISKFCFKNDASSLKTGFAIVGVLVALFI